MIKTQVIQKEDFTLAANHKLKFANVKNMTLPKIAPRSIPENIVQSDTLGTEGKQQHISIEKDPKFKKAINSFDQILQDFISAKEEKISKIPKLQKSKTCCVIESKCIYKRTLSLPNGHCENLKSKTKSLLDLNQEEMREYSAKPHGFKNDNVKSTIQKFNQLTATQKNITIHDSDRVPKKISKSLSLNDKIYSSDSPFRQKNANNKLSRSISSNSEQNEEKRNMSRIPVNTNLRRSFPSTPLGLNKLDQQNGSHVFKETELHSKFSKSVQNLSRSSALSMAKSTGLSSRNGGSTYDLSKSVQNLSKCSPKMSSSRMSISKNNPDIFKSVQNLSRYSKTSMIKTNLTQTKLSSNLSKSVHNINKNYSKSPVGKSAKLGGNSSSGLSKSVSNLSRTPPKISKYTNIAGSKYNEHSKSSTNLEKISLKRSVSKSTGLLSKSTQNLSKNSQSKVFVESSTPTKIRRDFVNSSLKNSQDFQMDNAEAKIVEMKKVIEAKIDQQLKELSLDETDFQITGNVKSKIEQFSKNKEHRELSEECFIALKCPKDAEVQSVTKKYTDIESIQHKTVNLKKSDTFKKKISTFSKPPLVKKEIRDTYDEKLPPKVTPRIKNTFSKKNSIDNIESKHSSIELTIPHGDQNVFGVKKQSAEPKFIENTAKKLIQLRKNSFSKNTYDINLNIKNVKEFSKMMTAKEKALNGWVDSDNLNSKVDRVIYGSDDSSSDDSGNISTEIENDECSSPVEVESKNLDIPGVKQEQVFLRNGILSQLEAQRDECLGGMVVKLQARCRGYLARNKLSQRKLQDLAVRCIQRNVRKFMLVRDWPWWRLLVRVTPLLNVHRTEEKLKLKTDELEALKLRLEKLEQERSLLKHENDKLEAKMSELTADLAEEHSAATLASERLEAETSERIRLERELSDAQTKNKELNRNSERLEMELLYARSDLNGISEEVDEDHEGENGGVYKQRYERVFRELEFTKRRLRQQHEDDLEQLVGLKKQLEKKLNDAYEEAEEQRQVVGQWKNKVQKLNGEMNDLKLLLEEQNARNNLLEKKQRRFDSETQMLNEELKKERNAKDRTLREKEVLMAEKYSLETTLADTRLELELKEEKLNALQREYDEITCGERTEEEVTNLRRQKIEMERRLQDQEEELDELASQVQLLEQAKLRLEMTLESMRKEAKKESQLRDDEVEEMRGNAQKRVKALEAQLENEHEERTILLRQKHELERRLASAAESERHDREGDEVLIRRLKNDLRKTKALLRDCQTQLDMQKADAPGKNVIRQLKNQLEDLECARALAVKTKQSLESELSETQAQLDESNRQRREAEERANLLSREKSELQSQLEENEEELAEVFKKYKAAIQQMSLDQMALQEQVSLVSELEVERNQLKEQLAELTSKLESAEYMGDASSSLLAKRNELKVKELESKLDLEQSTRSRLEIQISRLKESVEKLQSEVTLSKTKEQQAHDQIKKLQRALRETKEELNATVSKEMEAIQKKKDLEKRLENLEAEAASDRNDLKLAKKRIEDLQFALQGELGDSVSDHSESDPGDSDCDSVDTYLPNHRGSSVDARRFDSLSRSSTSSSNLGKEASFT